MAQGGNKEDKGWGRAGGADGVELGVGGELEGVAGDGAVGGVEARAARAPERLQDVLDRLLGPRARQQWEVHVPPQHRRRAALPLHLRGSVLPYRRRRGRAGRRRRGRFGSGGQEETAQKMSKSAQLQQTVTALLVEAHVS